MLHEVLRYSNCVQFTPKGQRKHRKLTVHNFTSLLLHIHKDLRNGYNDEDQQETPIEHHYGIFCFYHYITITLSMSTALGLSKIHFTPITINYLIQLNVFQVASKLFKFFPPPHTLPTDALLYTNTPTSQNTYRMLEAF